LQRVHFGTVAAQASRVAQTIDLSFASLPRRNTTHRNATNNCASPNMAARDASPTSTSSTLSNITVQTEKQIEARIMSSASPSISTPPTSLDDEYSVQSDNAKTELLIEVTEDNHVPRGLEDALVTPHPPQDVPLSDGRRSARSSRNSVATYNVQILAGTAIHTPTKYLEKHHKNVLHGALESPVSADDLTPAKKRAYKLKQGLAAAEDPAEEQLAAEAAQAARRRTSSRVTDLRKEALRNISGVGQVVANALSDGKTLVQNTLRRSASDGALKSRKLKRPAHASADDEGTDTEGISGQEFLKPKAKLWLRQGLYVGQHREFNPRLSESQNRARKRTKRRQDDDVLPLPMFAADRVLNEDPHHVFKDFKLPFDTYNPLPRKVKVDGWVKLSKSMVPLRFYILSADFFKIDSLARLLLCGSVTSKMRLNVIVTPTMVVAKLATTASWPTSVTILIAHWEHLCAVTDLLPNSSGVPKEIATTMVSKLWTLQIVVTACAL
jgi:palmitoyltransferase ZDHHC9/14/18